MAATYTTYLPTAVLLPKANSSHRKVAVPYATEISLKRLRQIGEAHRRQWPGPINSSFPRPLYLQARRLPLTRGRARWFSHSPTRPTAVPVDVSAIVVQRRLRRRPRWFDQRRRSHLGRRRGPNGVAGHSIVERSNTLSTGIRRTPAANATTSIIGPDAVISLPSAPRLGRRRVDTPPGTGESQVAVRLVMLLSDPARPAHPHASSRSRWFGVRIPRKRRSRTSSRRVVWRVGGQVHQLPRPGRGIVSRAPQAHRDRENYTRPPGTATGQKRRCAPGVGIVARRLIIQMPCLPAHLNSERRHDHSQDPRRPSALRFVGRAPELIQCQRGQQARGQHDAHQPGPKRRIYRQRPAHHHHQEQPGQRQDHTRRPPAPQTITQPKHDEGRYQRAEHRR